MDADALYRIPSVSALIVSLAACSSDVDKCVDAKVAAEYSRQTTHSSSKSDVREYYGGRFYEECLRAAGSGNRP